MNISVTEASGLPPNAYLSLRVGDTRRQGPFKKGDSISFPKVDHTNFILDVFEKVASTQVSLEGLRVDDEIADKVSLRRSNAPRVELSVKVSKSQTSGTDEPRAASARKKAANKAKTYLEKNQVHNILQKLVHNLVVKQPDDPIEYMYDYIGSYRNPMRPGIPVPEPKPNCSRNVAPLPEPEPGRKNGSNMASFVASQKEFQPAEQEADTETTAEDAALPGLGNEEYPGFPVDAIPEEMPDLRSHHSVMAAVLNRNPSIYKDLCKKATEQGITFGKIIKSGVDSRGHAMLKIFGAFAGDEGSYDTFKAFFDPAISSWHSGFAVDALHRTDLEPLNVTPINMDRTGKFVVSCSIMSGRNIRGLRLTPAITVDERREVERVLTRALLDLTGDMKGTYYPLSGSDSYDAMPGGMDFDDEEALRERGFLISEPDSKYMLSSGIGRNWPDARGVYLNDNNDFLVWLNEEDHIQLTAMQDGANIQKAFALFCKAESKLSNHLKRNGYEFMHNDHLGFISASPANLGTGLRVVVRVRLPKLTENTEGLQKLIQGMSLNSVRWGDIVEIQNRVKLGNSEVEIVNHVIECVQRLIQMEKDLSSSTQESSMQDIEGTASIFQDIPGLGDDEYPGFPVDECPTELPDLNKHYSLVANALKENPALYDELKSKRTQQGVTLAKIIKPGMDLAGHPMVKIVGMVAGDEESYHVFKKLFDPILKIKHDNISGSHPTDLDPAKVIDVEMDPSGKYIESAQISTGRNIRGFRLSPSITKEERRKVEGILAKALLDLQGNMKGKYLPLQGSQSYLGKPGGMSDDELDALTDAFLFHEPDSRLLLSAGIGRHWPDARGVFLSNSKNYAAFINEDDHICIRSVHSGAKMKAAFTDLCKTEAAVQDALKQQGYTYMHNDRLGFITPEISNLGSGLRVEVKANLPLMLNHPDFRSICEKLGILFRQSHDHVTLFNHATIGTSEVSLVNKTIEAVSLLVQMEMALEKGESIQAL